MNDDRWDHEDLIVSDDSTHAPSCTMRINADAPCSCGLWMRGEPGDGNPPSPQSSAVDANGAPMPVPNAEPHVQDLVIEDIHARRELGIQRYGTGLQAFNGRNALRDLYEELLDAACYARQRLEEEAQRPAQIVVADDLELIEGILDIHGDTSASITRDVEAGVIDEEDDLFVPVSKIAETLRRIRSRPTPRYALVSDLICLSCGAPTLVTPTSSPTDTP